MTDDGGESKGAPGEISGEMAARAAVLVTSLTGTLTSIMDRLDEVTSYGRRSRIVIIGLAASVALDVSLSVISQNVTLHQSQLNACAGGNAFRAQQLSVWNHLLGLTSAAPETSAQRAQIASFKAYLSKVYVPSKCARLYPS